MIYFDIQTIKILVYIRFHNNNGVTWQKLIDKFPDDISPSRLVAFNDEDYLITKNSDGNWIKINNDTAETKGSFISFTTDKANELLENKILGFAKWTIPTLISVTSLVISCLNAMQ